MRRSTYDVIVIGLGAMGSAAAYHLARRGQRVLGLDRYRPPHGQGSSHGKSRIIREAYFEHPSYVPLVQRAYVLWRELERDSGRSLLQITGGLMIGPPESSVVMGARTSAVAHGLAFEELDADAIARRFPAFRPAREIVAIFEPNAGILAPEVCIQAHLDLARATGATLQDNEPVLEWEIAAGQVTVRTERGSYRARRLVISVGAWICGALAQLELPVEIERQVLYWLGPARTPEFFDPSRCPIFIWEYAKDKFFYGFPDTGNGVKVALHHQGEPADPNRPRRPVSDSEENAIRELLRRYLPAANGPVLERQTCLYTNAPDGNFILDAHPRFPEVVLASPCSGHGFKFSGVVGEVIGDLVVEGRTRFDISLFNVRRFQSQKSRDADPRGPVA